jgi:hypothetical protein
LAAVPLVAILSNFLQQQARHPLTAICKTAREQKRTDFMTKVAEERQKLPTQAWLNKAAQVEVRHRPAAEKVQFFFGKHIYEAVSLVI